MNWKSRRGERMPPIGELLSAVSLIPPAASAFVQSEQFLTLAPIRDRSDSPPSGPEGALPLHLRIGCRLLAPQPENPPATPPTAFASSNVHECQGRKARPGSQSSPCAADGQLHSAQGPRVAKASRSARRRSGGPDRASPPASRRPPPQSARHQASKQPKKDTERERRLVQREWIEVINKALHRSPSCTMTTKLFRNNQYMKSGDSSVEVKNNKDEILMKFFCLYMLEQEKQGREKALVEHLLGCMDENARQRALDAFSDRYTKFDLKIQEWARFCSFAGQYDPERNSRLYRVSFIQSLLPR